MNIVLLDTGPLVALLDRSEPDHDRVQSCMARLHGSRLVTTGAVITEAFYFLSDVRDGPSSLASFLADSATEVRDAFRAEALAAAIGLMSQICRCAHGFSGRDARVDRRALRDRSNPDTGSARFYIVSIPKEPPVQIAAGL